MLDLQHNVVSILYSLKGMIESHLTQVREGRLSNRDLVLKQAEDVLTRAYGQADRALRIARRIGLIHQAGPDRSNSERRGFIQKAWQKTLKLLSKEISFHKIEIVNRVPQNFPAIHCEEEALTEIFYHLAKNAIQAMPQGGSLFIQAQITHLPAAGKASARNGEPHALLTITDTGPGIQEEKLPYLFDPFFTTKAEKEGNGLGLYLTEALVVRNQGKITVSSFQDFGTTFGLEFQIYQRNGYDGSAEKKKSVE